MNAINTTIDRSNGFPPDGAAFVSEPVSGTDLTVGMGFEAQSFRARDIGEAMDPLVMVDHYLMTGPTFGVHPHAGLSAVSLLFKDSEGLLHNRDSLGSDFDLRPGDLYWLSAGSGAVHDESPRANARIHGLQVFVNVPQTQRFGTPASLLIRSTDMPVIEDRDYRVKVALGVSNGVQGANSPSIEMTILDGTVHPGGRFSHEALDNRGVWVQAVEGSLHVVVGETVRNLACGEAIAVRTDGRAVIRIGNSSPKSVHFVLFDGARIAEAYVHDGPFVMGSEEQIANVKAAYEAGHLGSVADSR